MRYWGIPVFILLFFSCIQAQEKRIAGTYRFAFYNVENLFDTINHTLKKDDEFTPGSKNNWNTERYWKKQQDLAAVIDSMGLPVIIGLSEVENANVLRDLCKSISGAYYQFIHQESPDDRGIDVAFLYQPEFFRPVADSAIGVLVQLNDATIAGTRDILHVAGIFKPTGDSLHFFINHWPSRVGGLEASEQRRMAAADTLSHYIRKIWQKYPARNIIIMGDLNDEPTNRSVSTNLVDQTLPPDTSQILINLAIPAKLKGLGTYNYRGEWNLLDQIIISSNLTTAKGPLLVRDFKIFDREFLMYESERFGKTPNRTYGGPNYYGGCSDHLPVFIEVIVK
jgi:predicted extracellular nuclease